MSRFGVADACLTVAVVFLAVALAFVARCVVLLRRAAVAASIARARSRSVIADRLSWRPAFESSKPSASSAL
jgi:hypothetical protein